MELEIQVDHVRAAGFPGLAFFKAPANRGDFILIGPQRGKPSGQRLDCQPDFAEMAKKPAVGLQVGMPSEDVRIEQVPFRSRLGSGARTRPNLQHALVRQHLDRFADNRAADTKLFAKLRFVRETQCLTGAFGHEYSYGQCSGDARVQLLFRVDARKTRVHRKRISYDQFCQCEKFWPCVSNDLPQ
jgi:hypothetical protein